MFQRDKSFTPDFTPDFTPEIIDAAHRKARRERSRAFHDLFGTLGQSLKGLSTVRHPSPRRQLPA